MQALGHASRRALRASVVMQETCVALAKAYSSEAASPVKTLKSREGRYELAKQFVAKFKAANNGQLPGITLLRKEVGGKYETLKEVLQELAKGQDEPDTLKQIVESKDAEGKTQELCAAVKDGDEKPTVQAEDSKKDKKPTVKAEDSKKDKKPTVKVDDLKKDKKPTVKAEDMKKDEKEMPQVSKRTKAVKSVDQAHSKITSKDMGQTIQSVMPIKDASKSIMDTLLTSDEDDDDDSDVAAPEYHHTPLTHHKMEVGVKPEKGKEKVLRNGPVSHLKSDMKKQNDDRVFKSKHTDIKQLEMQDSAKKIELPLKGMDAGSAVVKSMDDTAAKHPLTDGSFSYRGKPYGPVHTTVVRMMNLPPYMTANKLKAVCENVARVHEVDMRRGRIADVQFDVDIQEMNDLLNRLRLLSIGPFKLRVFPAHRFSCGSNANSQCKPQDLNHLKWVRTSLFYSLEQRFRFLCWQVQDYRELQDLKLAR